MMRVLSSSKTKWHFMQTQCAVDGHVTHFCGSKDGTRQRQTRNQPSLTIVLYDADSHRRQQINVVIVSSSSHSGETDIRLILLSPGVISPRVVVSGKQQSKRRDSAARESLPLAADNDVTIKNTISLPLLKTWPLSVLSSVTGCNECHEDCSIQAPKLCSLSPHDQSL